MLPIFDTTDVYGDEYTINFDYVVYVKQGTISRTRTNPCNGHVGASCLTIVLSSGQSILISCDHDGNEITEDFIKAFKRYHASKKLSA